MRVYTLSLVSNWSLTWAVWIFACSPACRGLEESANCDYFYVLQPPSELPCNPYQIETMTESYVYNISLECAVATQAVTESEIRWVEVLDSELEDGSFHVSTDIYTLEGFTLFQSVLHITTVPQPNISHVYWCEFHTLGKETQESFINKLTIYEPEFYASFPPCPQENSGFHLAQKVCVSNDSLSDDPPSVSDTEGSFPLRTAVIVAAAIGAVLLVLLVVIVIMLVVCCLYLRRKNKAIERVVPDRQGNQTPPTGTAQENQTVTVLSDTHPEVPFPMPVTPQRPSVVPPTHVHSCTTTARKRAASLFRRLQKPCSPTVDIGAKVADATVSFDTNDNNKQGPPPRKKPYKSLELKTVEDPNFYMKTAKSPKKCRKPPPPRRVPPPHTTSREKLLLTTTTSNGYIVPAGGIEGVQKPYQEIEPCTLDYLGLYTVPRQHTPSTSSEEPPLYEEPRLHLD